MKYSDEQISKVLEASDEFFQSAKSALDREFYDSALSSAFRFDILIRVELDDCLLPVRIWQIEKTDITQLKNTEQWDASYHGRISLKDAFTTGKARIIFPIAEQ